MYDDARALNSALPERLRITVSADIAATVDELIGRGWTVPEIAATITRRTNTNSGTGAVVYLLRNLGAELPPSHRTTTAPAAVAPHAYVPGDELPYCQMCQLPIGNRHHTSPVAA